MSKIFVWPLLVSSFHLFAIFSIRFQEDQTGLGFRGMGVTIIEYFLLESLVLYIPLCAVYLLIQKLRRKGTSILVGLGLAVVSLLAPFFGIRNFPFLNLIDTILQSDWWWLRFEKGVF